MQPQLMDNSIVKVSHRRVAYWLVLAVVLLLVIGTFTLQWVGRYRDLGDSGAERREQILVAQVVVASSSALAILSVLIAGLQLRAEAAQRRQAEVQLQDALASVEQQVAERTDALSRAMATVEISEQQLHLALDERATALATAEAARRVAEEASQLKDEFLATASHELRTPLNAIVGWVHVLQSGAVVSDEQRRHAVSAIDRNAKIQTRLIEDLLDVSRMIQGRVTLTVAPTDVRAVVDAALDAIKPAALAKHTALQVSLPMEAVTVLGDSHRLHQVVRNLLANAVKYTPGGGAITVMVKTIRGRAEIVVADTGEGIAPAFLPHVFEPFRQGASTTMRTGMGLGLAIVERLVELHGGSITVNSAGVGKGTEFVVSLPLAAAVVVPDSPAAIEPVFQHLHVLVAEDDADSAAAVTAILRLHGCETQTAGTAAECLRITGEWPTDVLVCDIGLPDDDGYGLLRRLRRLPAGANIPAIALTAFARPEDRARALAAGFRAHLSKPLDPASLLREIASAVRA